jgi:hypothetical protein
MRAIDGIWPIFRTPTSPARLRDVLVAHAASTVDTEDSREHSMVHYRTQANLLHASCRRLR